MIGKILEFADKHTMFPESGIVLACVSGGADSMCLLEALMQISYEWGFKVAVAHFNHMLRGAESDRDEAFVCDYCSRRGIDYYGGKGDVTLYAKQNGLSIEVAARDLRYGFFYDLAGKLDAEKIATAHNADDNTETLIINLTRGAGTNGLSGIPPIRGKIIRPMLSISRDEIIKFLSENSIDFVEDSTNSMDVYTRNKIRHLVMPTLKEINPKLNEAAAVTAELMREDEKMISELAESFITKNQTSHTSDGIKLSDGAAKGAVAKDFYAGPAANCKEILKLPFAVSSRVIRKLYGGNLSFSHVKACLELCKSNNPSAKLSLPGMTAYRSYDMIVFESEPLFGADGFIELFPADGDSMVISEAGLKVSCKAVICDGDDEVVKVNKTLTSFLFKTIDIYGKMAVRPRREGDKIRLANQDGTKTLKKLFIERRIPAGKRSFIPVIADGKGVLAIYGIGMGDRAVPVQGDMAVRIDFESI